MNSISHAKYFYLSLNNLFIAIYFYSSHSQITNQLFPHQICHDSISNITIVQNLQYSQILNSSIFGICLVYSHPQNFQNILNFLFHINGHFEQLYYYYSSSAYYEQIPFHFYYFASISINAIITINDSRANNLYKSSFTELPQFVSDPHSISDNSPKHIAVVIDQYYKEEE